MAPDIGDRSRKLGFRKSLAFSLITILVLLTAAELAIRSWAYFFREQYERYDVSSQTFVLVPGEHRRGSTIIRVNEHGFLGADLRNGQHLRIVALGDSCTFGPGDHAAAYPAMLQERLSVSGFGANVEVVNAGVEGLSSEMALQRLRHQIAPLEPDVVTVYIGWNDLMKLDPVGQADVTAQAAVVRWLDRLWLVKGMRKALFFYLRPMVMPPEVGAASFRGVFTGFRPVVFEQNLQDIIAGIRQLGARPVLFTLSTVVHPQMTLDELRKANVFFPYFGSAYAVGDFLELVGAYNRSIRHVAEAENVPLVELDGLMSGVPGAGRYFYDTMHPSAEGRSIIVESLAEVLSEAGILPASAHVAD
jgi:lysophospholipase L1-like esterase